jgi:hypothetical protein
VAAAIGLFAFGVVRGVMPAGPARGERFVVTLAPPVDTAARTTAEQSARERLAEPGQELRIVSNGDRFVIEVGEIDPEIIGLKIALLERTKAGVPAMRVVSRTAFTRATGFFPRAWPFLAAGLVLLVVAGIVWRRK